MEAVMGKDRFFNRKKQEEVKLSEAKKTETAVEGKRNLLDGEAGQTYIVRDIHTDDEEMNAFLFRLGCYSGEPITLMSKKKKNCIVVIKDGRYSIDNVLAEAIIV